MNEENSLGLRLKKRRVGLNLTLNSLSEKCGLSPQLISDYENDRKEPGIKNLKLLCGALDVTPNYFLCDDPWDIGRGVKKTYGMALQHYLAALDLSEKDVLDIDKENQTVDIHIKDEILLKTFLQLKDFLKPNSTVSQTMQNFNINILSQIEIKRK